MTETPNLTLPYILGAQSQKHVTHNEALRTLDAVVQLAVISRDRATPPDNSAQGARYIVASPATGLWQGKDNLVAAWQDNGWIFYTPQEGWLAWVNAQGKLLVWSGQAWDNVSSASSGGENSINLTNFLGINAAADAANRLVVSAPNSLFSHEGAGHRLKVNKAAASDTASLLFQDDFSGRAEMGLSGDDDFHLKVSANGSAWHDSIVADKETGKVTFPSGIKNPVLSGSPPGGLNGSDAVFIDAVNGDDSNDGTSVIKAIRTPAALETVLPVGRAVTLFVLNDLVWDYVIGSRYPIASLQIFGLNSNGVGYTKRKITVKDATNHGSLPGCIVFYAPSSIYMSGIDIDLDTSKASAFMLYNNTMGYFRTANMTLRRLGTGNCCLFANGASFVPSQHSGLTIDASAKGYVATGVAAGANPNNDWRYPSNVTGF